MIENAWLGTSANAQYHHPSLKKSVAPLLHIMTIASYVLCIITVSAFLIFSRQDIYCTFAPFHKSFLNMLTEQYDNKITFASAWPIPIFPFLLLHKVFFSQTSKLQTRAVQHNFSNQLESLNKPKDQKYL